MDTAALRARNAEFWDQIAPGWIRHADRHDAFGRPFGAAAFDRLAPRPGERIVDIGCGCGGTTAELTTAVGRAGAAVGLDLNAQMIDAARERFSTLRPAPSRSDLRPEFLVADVETVGVIPGAPFDAAYSRMALMLLADPVAGLTAIRRSLRPDGRLAATVFQAGSTNPWLTAVMLGAAPHVGALPPLPIGAEPGPFAFAAPDRVRGFLTAAGFDRIEIQGYRLELPVPDEPDTVAEWLIEMGPAGAAYRAAPPAGMAAARDGVARLLDRYRRPGSGYRLPCGVWLVTASNPAEPPITAGPRPTFGPTD